MKAILLGILFWLLFLTPIVFALTNTFYPYFDHSLQMTLLNFFAFELILTIVSPIYFLSKKQTGYKVYGIFVILYLVYFIIEFLNSTAGAL